MRNPILLVLFAAACGAPSAGGPSGESGEPAAGDEGDGGSEVVGAEGEGEGEGEGPPPCVPLDEVCDGVDNDCDGGIDEGIDRLGEVCATGLGGCRREGVRVCTADGGGTFCGAEPGTPEAERCDAVDNDCDGGTDEAFGDLGGACTQGVGGCAATGVFVCAEDGSAAVCGATPGGETSETCDGEDNDCDGVVDEAVDGLATECEAEGEGACAAGAEVCQEGRAVCVPAPPAPEACARARNGERARAGHDPAPGRARAGAWTRL